MANTVTSSPRLPIEVIERVIDSIYPLQYYENVTVVDQRIMWKACALSCRAMAPRSQFWLFREIWLRSEAHALSFTKLLRGKNMVARHVRFLAMTGPESSNPLRRYTWISWVPLVLAPRMKNLQELWLQYDVFWDSHPRLPQALTAFKSIRRLILHGTSFPNFGQCIRLIRAFPHLNHLSFDSASWKPDPPSSPLVLPGNQICPQEKRLNLAHLILGGDHLLMRRIVKWLLDAKATKTLITFYGYAAQIAITKGIAFPSKSSIRSMVLDYQNGPPTHIPNLSLSDLQFMHLKQTVDRFPIQLLKSIAMAGSHQLRELTVYLKVEYDNIPVLGLTEDEITAFAKLDTALCTPDLNKIRLIVCLYDKGASSEAMSWWQRKLTERLPKVSSAEGRLVLKRTLLTYPLERWFAECDGFRQPDYAS